MNNHLNVIYKNCMIPPGTNDHAKVLNSTFTNDACRPAAFASASA